MTRQEQRAEPSAEPAVAIAPISVIRDGILTGTYGPNQRLTEMDLSAELGVSRQTVGIALVRLEQEGLVVTQPNRGASVRSVSVAEALRALRVREALEGVAASLAAQFVTRTNWPRWTRCLRRCARRTIPRQTAAVFAAQHAPARADPARGARRHASIACWRR